MQAQLGAALQKVIELQEILATTLDERDMISEQLQLLMMELNATNEALIWVKAYLLPNSIFEDDSWNCVFCLKTIVLQTLDATRTLFATTSVLSTLSCHFVPHVQVSLFADEYGICIVKMLGCGSDISVVQQRSSLGQPQVASPCMCTHSFANHPSGS